MTQYSGADGIAQYILQVPGYSSVGTCVQHMITAGLSSFVNTNEAGLCTVSGASPQYVSCACQNESYMMARAVAHGLTAPCTKQMETTAISLWSRICSMATRDVVQATDPGASFPYLYIPMPTLSTFVEPGRTTVGFALPSSTPATAASIITSASNTVASTSTGTSPVNTLVQSLNSTDFPITTPSTVLPSTFMTAGTSANTLATTSNNSNSTSSSQSSTLDATTGLSDSTRTGLEVGIPVLFLVIAVAVAAILLCISKRKKAQRREAERGVLPAENMSHNPLFDVEVRSPSRSTQGTMIPWHNNVGTLDAETDSRRQKRYTTISQAKTDPNGDFEEYSMAR